MNKQSVIIKKIKKKSSERHHGGQWKVAYADFVTAMMAFFLLLWLLSMVSPEKRARLAEYFKFFNIFHESGHSFMEQTSQVLNESGIADKINRELDGLSIKPEEFQESIKRAIEEKLGDVKDQVIVDYVEGGVRIQLVDKEGKPMFALGSSVPTPLAERILSVIGENIKDLPNPVVVEGHTDSLQYKDGKYNNWDLSTERALVAKKRLEYYGLVPNRLTKVAGYADTLPLIKEDTRDPRNRRISIILLFPQKK